MTAYFAPIVEGQGEERAVPLLLRRIVGEVNPECVLAVNAPIRIKAGSFIHDSEYFARYVSLAAAKAAQHQGVVLILLDCEDDCPATLGPMLLASAQRVRGDVPYLVALAHREYETWFLASAESLRGQCGLSDDLLPPPGPEAIRGAKEWLGSQMPIPYDPIRHQTSMTSAMDFGSARRVASFDRLYRKVQECCTMAE